MFESLTTTEKLLITFLVTFPVVGDIVIDSLYYYAGIDLIFY